ncbi:Wadjet anti-phage system protein JetD domain-containing protein [Bacillus sp. CECT 9360]|uniref:Wadjet anti-phage system protein JetD domain-containing protein n=1 Tax=Bacillus sp. CECT 9360 TaxID=2845821 RepID=UPI001E36EBBD|nr:Wadjet anti-phage system protein JetD domain-containing protein [Bacillus sp. CECT 9360]CAH0345732.1 hypothetical protein BCI9360_02030 [Bacillus sp. CECT 9360]
MPYFYERLKSYFHSFKQQSKKKLNIEELEQFVITELNSFAEYQKLGGYQEFYNSIQLLKKDGVLVPVKKNKPNGRDPILPVHWWFIPPHNESKWEAIKMLQMSDKIKLNSYKSNPLLQTEDEWNRISSVYHFLKNSTNREVISREERSLELFNDEKFLSETEGRAFLSRIGVALGDLKAEAHGEPFVFWLQPGKELTDINTVLIVENKSFFHTCVKLMRRNELLLNPQVIIYGEGKHIENSFSFFFEMFPKNEYHFYYVGDIDPEGWGIYYRLLQNFPNTNFQLAVPLYQKMIEISKKDITVNHHKNENHLGFIINELDSRGEYEIKDNVNELWIQNIRIPQEVLTIETLSRGEVNE